MLEIITEKTEKAKTESMQQPKDSSAATASTENLMVPREIAEETLQSLIPFVTAVTELCRNVGERLWSGEDVAADFNRVIDGIEILVEGVQTSRVVLQVREHQGIDTLHQELVSLLSRLMEAMGSGASDALERRVELLTTLLPGNLEQWVNSGIPSLIRSRDS